MNMKKIIVKCDINFEYQIERHLATYFQGWLMERLDSTYAEHLHQQVITPYSISTQIVRDEIWFILNLLDNDAIKYFSAILLDLEPKIILLKKSNHQDFLVREIVTEAMSLETLSSIFYQTKGSNQKIKIIFESPTSFKSKGDYVFYPDLRLILQSLMKQYSYFFENEFTVEKDLLEHLMAYTAISSYQLKSFHYPVHRARIPAFLGEITIQCRGNQTLKSYLRMLLALGNFTGVGIKTSMGMGSIRSEELGGRR